MPIIEINCKNQSVLSVKSVKGSNALIEPKQFEQRFSRASHGRGQGRDRHVTRWATD